MCDLNNKKALVTGATGGIGGAIAKDLHSRGAIVAISGTREKKLQELAKELGEERVHIMPCDLSNKEEVKALSKDAEKTMGGIDILVCNAGITKDNLAMRMSEDDWQSVLDINLTSVFLLIKTALRGMMKKRSGSIINIGSVVGTSGNLGQANYVASKAGLVGLTKSIALEAASRGITANCIAPGFIITEMTDKLTDNQKASIIANIPSGTMGKVEDIAGVASFLASDAAKYITGQTIHVNGGMVMI